MSVEQMLRSEDMRVVNSAKKELLSLPSDKAIAILEKLAAEPNPEFQARALSGMAKISRPHAEVLAVRFLSDPTSRLHPHAIHTAWKVGSRVCVPLIVRVLATSPVDIARSWAAFALGDLGDESVLPSLTRAVEHDTGVNHEGEPIRNIAQKSIDKIRAQLAKQPDHNSTM